MKAGYCIVEYNGAKAGADHLSKGVTVKGVHFASGARVEVTAQLAGIFRRSVPDGACVVHDGTPDDSPPVPATVKEELRRVERQREAHPVDPAKALELIRPLSKATVDLLGKSEAALVKAVEAGEVAAEDMFSLAFYARLVGRAELGKVCARQAEAPPAKE